MKGTDTPMMMIAKGGVIIVVVVLVVKTTITREIANFLPYSPYTYVNLRNSNDPF